ncbi:MAG: HPF/RaiA family ribosome-associated protein [Pirellulales bacterium]|nr:HPF/RaiA family ribosome-associated protein [Pirellulales bacterium]
MRVHVRCKNVKMTQEIRGQLRTRLSFALGRFAHRIKEVTARLADVNGAKGGEDKQCRLVVRLHPNSKVTIEETAGDVLAAIARAAGRAKNAVGRALRRRRDARIGRGGFSPQTAE